MAVKKEDRGFGKDERDLLIRLDQRMAGVEVAINKIDSGVTGRLLNLESNSVSKIQFDDHEERLRETEKGREDNAIAIESLNTKFNIWGIVGGAIWTLITIAITVYFSKH